MHTDTVAKTATPSDSRPRQEPWLCVAFAMLLLVGCRPGVGDGARLRQPAAEEGQPGVARVALVTRDSDWNADSERPLGRSRAPFLPATAEDRASLENGYVRLERVCWTYQSTARVELSRGTRDLPPSLPDEHGTRCYDFPEPQIVTLLNCICEGPECKADSSNRSLRCEAYGAFDRGPIE